MTDVKAVAGTVTFFVVAPGTVAGLVPGLISRWSVGGPVVAQLAGVVLIGIGSIPLLSAFVAFARAGGTPAPVAPTQHLVVDGFNRYVRNPMYIGVLAIICGQAVLFVDAGVGVWALLVWAATSLFVRLYEEPTLNRTFGEEYDAYRRAVPRWRPRLSAWHPSV